MSKPSKPPNTRLIASGLEFPEGPVWLPDGSILLVEIRGQRLTRLQPDGTRDTVAHIPGGPNGAAIGPDGKCWVCNNGGFRWADFRGVLLPQGAAQGWQGGSIQRVDLQTGAVETIADRCGTVVEVVPGMMPTNGIGLSPDQKVLYVAETPTARLWAFDLAAPGVIAPCPPSFRAEIGRPIAGLGGYQMFDSLAVEAGGNICVATLVSGGIAVIAPDGTLLEQIPTGDQVTTNIAFGGPDLRTAFITLSGRGELVAMDWPRPGLELDFQAAFIRP
ncbi:MAG: SMP-30/gluconolactonase/LRE family protein [Variovorax sp.]